MLTAWLKGYNSGNSWETFIKKCTRCSFAFENMFVLKCKSITPVEHVEFYYQLWFSTFNSQYIKPVFNTYQQLVRMDLVFGFNQHLLGIATVQRSCVMHLSAHCNHITKTNNRVLLAQLKHLNDPYIKTCYHRLLSSCCLKQSFPANCCANHTQSN